jgi:ribosomal protein S18 acetylase RimI-like enzyme
MIREANLNDLKAIWELRLETTELLKERDIDQWQYIDPSIETIKEDISKNEFFVYELSNKIIGMIAIKKGIEKTYDVIYDGKWHYDLPYVAIHRLAVKRNQLGSKVAFELMQFAEIYAKEQDIHYIRIDTHEKNRYAIRLFQSLDYTLCGYILLVQEKGDLKRLAYDKHL